MRPDASRRALLVQERERTRMRVDELEAQLRMLTHARRGEFDDDEHDPEGATLSSQWSMLSGLLETARAEQRQAESAIDRLEAGTYGVCATCGTPIPAPQLEARPFREQCVACASADASRRLGR